MNKTFKDLIISTNIPHIFQDSPTCGDSPLTPLSDEHDSEQELDFNIPNIFTIDTNFDPSHEDNRKITYSGEDETLRFEFTEAQRNLAENAENAIDLSDLKIKVGVILCIFTLLFNILFDSYRISLSLELEKIVMII